MWYYSIPFAVSPFLCRCVVSNSRKVFLCSGSPHDLISCQYIGSSVHWSSVTSNLLNLCIAYVEIIF